MGMDMAAELLDDAIDRGQACPEAHGKAIIGDAASPSEIVLAQHCLHHLDQLCGLDRLGQELYRASVETA